MTELKPCPLCNGPAIRAPKGICCKRNEGECLMGIANLSEEAWNALPRPAPAQALSAPRYSIQLAGGNMLEPDPQGYVCRWDEVQKALASRPALAQAGEDIGSLVGFQRVSASDGAPAQAAEGDWLTEGQIVDAERLASTLLVTGIDKAFLLKLCRMALAALSTPPPDARLREALEASRCPIDCNGEGRLVWTNEQGCTCSKACPRCSVINPQF